MAQRFPPSQPPKSYADVAEDGTMKAQHKANRSNSKKSVRIDAAIQDAQLNGIKSDRDVAAGSAAMDLTSTTSTVEYEAALAQSKKERKPITPSAPEADTNELVSGRKVGQRWAQSAIRFAPLNVPLQRRLQTLTVLYHALSIAGWLSTFLLLCTVPVFWPLLIPYLIYTLMSQASTSGELSHRSERLRRSPMWSLFASYFPARLHRSQELPPTRKYVFGYHPHGIIAHGAFASFGTEALGFSQLFPGITNTLLTLDSNFRVPFYRDYALAMGLASVSRESCNNLLSKGGINREGMGRAITIVVGGARESLDAKPGTMGIVLNRRKGFIKLAIRNGADLVPVIGFGENDLYDQFESDSRIQSFQMWCKNMMGFTVPLFHGRGIFNYDVGLMPYRRPLNVVVGRPIKVIQNRQPDEATVDAVHAAYQTELQRVWDTNKDRFAKGRTSEMEIIE